MCIYLSVSHVNKDYSVYRKKIPALYDFSMSMEKEEFVSIVGPTGCGKTTLLRLLCGLLQPSDGTIHIEDVSPSEYCRKKNISFVFQKPFLFPWRTIMANILLPIEISLDCSIGTIREHAKSLLEMLGLSGFENAYPWQISGGMLQRAAFARAMITQPQLLLLDEPFNALDEITRERLWIDFSNIYREKGISILMVTHSIREAVFLSNRVLVMSHRPGHVKNEYHISLPNNRNDSVFKMQEYSNICEKIKKHF